MSVEQYVRDGNLKDALQELQENIRRKPDDSRYRVFLFQLLALLGEWKRALNQLNVLGNLDKRTWPMVEMYRAAIGCEVFRKEVFAGKHQPLILGEPPEWMALLIESFRLAAEKKYGEALSLRDQAFENVPESAGAINEQPFAWIADADSRLGPVLEVIIKGRYYWTPFLNIKTISITEAEDLRDFVWLPAQFTWTNGGQAYGLIPTRYPGSEVAHDSLIQMARRTEWLEPADGIYQGMGQRMLATDQDEYPLMDIRELSIHS